MYTAAAYHRIGAFRAYKAFQEAMRQFPGGVLPAGIDERSESAICHQVPECRVHVFR